MTKQTVTINGVAYDAHTGLPMRPQKAAPQIIVTSPTSQQKARELHRSQSVHHTVQRSQTLNRQTVKRTASIINHTKLSRPIIEKSPLVAKYAQHPADVKRVVRQVSDIGPIQHPMVAKAAHRMEQKTIKKMPVAIQASQVIKQEIISDALNKAPSHSKNNEQYKTKTKRYPRILSVTTVSFALLLLGGYFTYLNMPNLSVRVAAAQAGVNASYPEYHPDGYSLAGPVAYTQGEVSMKFAANTGPQSYTVTQEKSGWDSSAVLENYIKQKAGDNYITYNERGLTIYTFNDNAAWVNGGILYKIDGNSLLSSDQIRRIATSM